MLKYVLLGGAIAVAAPVAAQDASTAHQGHAATAAPAQSGAQDTMSSSSEPASPSGQASATPPTGGSAAPADSAAQTEQPAGGNEVSTIVNAEFAAYDKDANGTLDQTEFAAWMDALKAKAPTPQPSDAKWNEAAFAQADKDKSASLTKDELTGFLGGSAKAGSK
jgi:hypothetical protein